MKTLCICSKALIAFPQVAMEFVYLAWIHICMFVAMLKFAYVWHRSTLYVQYLCPSLSPLSHGSRLYSSIHACLFLSWIYIVLVYSHEFGYLCAWFNMLMYYRCLLDNMLWSSRHFHLVATTCSLKALVYRVSLRLMLWGASYYTKILSPPGDKTFDLHIFP